MLRTVLINCLKTTTVKSYNNVGVTFCRLRFLATANSHGLKIKDDPTSKNKPNTWGEDKVKESEENFLVRLKNDPDVFGEAAFPHEEVIDEGDVKEEQYLTEQPLPSRKLRTKQYADMIKGYIRKHKIKEALDVLEVLMLKQDRVKPENYIYNLLLGACGRVGYTKKAFSLYNDMKRRGLKVTGGTYTALFNACANSPWPLTDGLTRAQHLKEIMLEKQYEPNQVNYNVMVKAFGRCGDLSTAFEIVDEMVSKRIQIKDDTFNFLLQACITDKEAGFRHALLIWRKMINKKINPSIFTYNLFLKVIKDCGLGDLEATKQIIDKILQVDVKLLEEQKQIFLDTKQTVPLLEQNSLNSDQTEVLIEKSLGETRPNLMAEVPHLGNLVTLSEVTKPEDRLLLVGGYKGFLQNMENYQVKPDIKTVTQLLDIIPNSPSVEKEFISTVEKLKVKLDLDFFNMLIKKKSLRFDYEGGKDVLEIIKSRNKRPNLITYGVLALGCQTKEEALNLIESMKESSYSLNAPILGAMLKQACIRKNISYVLEIMEICLREEVLPSKKFMENLEEFKKRMKYEYDNKKLSKSDEKKFMAFKLRYKTWKNEVVVDDSEDVHPWQQYRKRNDADYKFRAKDTFDRFKPKHTSRFRVKTSEKHQNKL